MHHVWIFLSARRHARNRNRGGIAPNQLCMLAQLAGEDGRTQPHHPFGQNRAQFDLDSALGNAAIGIGVALDLPHRPLDLPRRNDCRRGPPPGTRRRSTIGFRFSDRGLSFPRRARNSRSGARRRRLARRHSRGRDPAAAPARRAPRPETLGSALSGNDPGGLKLNAPTVILSYRDPRISSTSSTSSISRSARSAHSGRNGHSARCARSNRKA